MALITRTFIEKTNTIFEGDKTNVGLNPIMELYYGVPISRGLIYFDLSRVKSLVSDKTYPDMSKLKHVLKMQNTGSLKSKYGYRFSKYNNCERAASFDLIFFLLNKDWDAGHGYDYYTDGYDTINRIHSEQGSNWYNATDEIKWDNQGVYSVNDIDRYYSQLVVARQHFDTGMESIEVDLTELVNRMIVGYYYKEYNSKPSDWETNYTDYYTIIEEEYVKNTLEEDEEVPEFTNHVYRKVTVENHGIGIAFSPDQESDTTEYPQYVGFFTGHTHTWFKPYLETTYNEVISDDRTNFWLDKDNRLYFYARVGGNAVNLDQLPTCTINGSEKAVKQATKGVYYVEVNFSSEEYEPETMYYDTWGNLSYNGREIPDVELYFTTKSQEGYFTFGIPYETKKPEPIVPSISGVNHNETIVQGDIRKVYVSPRIAYTTKQEYGVDDIEYRIYIKAGDAEITLTDWTTVERCYNENFFYVNTNEMVPATYTIDIKIKRDMEETIHKSMCEFEIKPTKDNPVIC